MSAGVELVRALVEREIERITQQADALAGQADVRVRMGSDHRQQLLLRSVQARKHADEYRTALESLQPIAPGVVSDAMVECAARVVYETMSDTQRSETGRGLLTFDDVAHDGVYKEEARRQARAILTAALEGGK